MTKPIRGILFDFNGTLLFDSSLHVKAFQMYFERHGIRQKSSDEIAKTIFGKSNKTIYSEFFGISDPTEEEWRAMGEEKEAMYRKLCLELPNGPEFVEGATELLDHLKENSIPFCLATGSQIDNVSFYMDVMNLGRWFDIDKNVVYFDGTFSGKPEPDSYLVAANKIGLDASECIVFEDGVAGLTAARRAKAGGVVCVCEEGFTPASTSEGTYDSLYHDLKNWKKILSDYGLMR